MGGEILVQSTPDVGSTFRVQFPLRAAPSSPVPDVAGPDLRGLQCLVFGGPDTAGADLATYLRHAGVVTQVATTLADIGSWARSRPPGSGVVVVTASGLRAEQAVAGCRALVSPRRDLRTSFVIIDAGPQGGRRPESDDVRRLSGDALRRLTFLRLVAQAAGRAAADHDQGVMPKPDSTPASNDSPPGMLPKRNVLVAEDNEVNQRVLQRQLALLGYAADFATTGREALQYLQTSDYELLLTDLHMPSMDGYELTIAVRASELGKRRMPIVALTANAVKGEAKRCRDIGMDDYMTKPVQLKDLAAMLGRWVPTRPIEKADPEPTSTVGVGEDPGTAPPVDLAVLTSLVGGDPAVIEELMRAFDRSSTRCSAEIRRSLREGRPAAAAEAAHMLKSSARSFGAARLYDLCEEIETQALHMDAPELASLLGRFEAETTALDAFLRRAKVC